MSWYRIATARASCWETAMEPFRRPIPYLPGGVFISTGDFNGDHKPDVAVASGSLSTVTVLLNVAAGYRWSTTTTLTSSPNPSAVNQSILLTATITNQIGGSPTGTVTFKSGSTTLGQGTVSNGQATLNYSFTSPGGVWIVASYSGDSTFLPSNSAPLRQAVTRASTTTNLASSPNPSQVGQNVQFTATVTAQYGGTPTGLVTFKDGSTVMAQVALDRGLRDTRLQPSPRVTTTSPRPMEATRIFGAAPGA